MKIIRARLRAPKLLLSIRLISVGAAGFTVTVALFMFFHTDTAWLRPLASLALLMFAVATAVGAWGVLAYNRLSRKKLVQKISDLQEHQQELLMTQTILIDRMIEYMPEFKHQD